MKQELINHLTTDNEVFTKEEIDKFRLDNSSLPDEQFVKTFCEKFGSPDQINANFHIRKISKDIGTIKNILLFFLVLSIITAILGTISMFLW